MRPGVIRNTNFCYKAPAGMQDCQDLHVHVYEDDGVRITTSAWIPSPQEVELIKAGQPIWLHVYGSGHPVVSMTVPNEDTMR